MVCAGATLALFGDIGESAGQGRPQGKSIIFFLAFPEPLIDSVLEPQAATTTVAGVVSVSRFNGFLMTYTVNIHIYIQGAQSASWLKVKNNLFSLSVTAAAAAPPPIAII